MLQAAKYYVEEDVAILHVLEFPDAPKLCHIQPQHLIDLEPVFAIRAAVHLSCAAPVMCNKSSDNCGSCGAYAAVRPT
jgi:hypothetical protein